jgi:hypothetical protein
MKNLIRALLFSIPVTLLPAGFVQASIVIESYYYQESVPGIFGPVAEVIYTRDIVIAALALLVVLTILFYIAKIKDNRKYKIKKSSN